MSVSSDPQAQPVGPNIVRFGVFEADLRAGDLRKKGVRIKIQDLPFRTLALLLSRPSEVVTREEFRQALWPQDIFVDFDRGISSAIKRLRDTLGDSADNPIFIETVERRGYRFIAPISVTAAPNADSAPSIAAVDREPSPPAPSLPAWKWAYALPLLTLLFAAWTLFPGFHSANTGNPLASTRTLHPANLEAKDLYLQGRYYWNKRTPDDLHKAVDFFTQAIVHDPGYSDAYVGLADCYNLLREYSAMPASEAYPRALAAARKAVELDPQSSQAHASLAFASFWGVWDTATGDREFRRAIELDPNNATAHHWYATCLANMSRYPEALAEIEHAQALDPTSKSILADKGDILAVMGRRQEAISLLLPLEKAEPEFQSPHRYLMKVYLEMADYPNYLAELNKEAAVTHDSSALIVASAAEKGFAAGGPHAMFQSMRREQQKLYDQGKLSPYVLAQTCALDGNKPDALKYLQAAFDQHDEYVTHIRTDHMFDTLHQDPPLRQILAALGVTNEQPTRTN